MKTVDLYDREEEETVSDDGEVVIDLFEPEAIDLNKKKPNFLEILKWMPPDSPFSHSMRNSTETVKKHS